VSVAVCSGGLTARLNQNHWAVATPKTTETCKELAMAGTIGPEMLHT
jgi:hypothetical protein